jgi:hypothetical protein
MLKGRRVLVVARTPTQDTAASVLETEEAVVDMVRAIVAEGGVVDLVADSSLALLGAMTAGEYFRPEPAEPSSERDRPIRASVRVHVLDEDDSGLEAFATMGQVELGMRGEDEVRAVRELSGNSAGLICIGMGRFDACVETFREQSGGADVFSMGATGRDARELHEKMGVEVLDLELGAEEPPRSSRRQLDHEHDRGDETDRPIQPEFEFPPLMLAAQVIVRRIAGLEDEPAGGPHRERG